VTKEKAYEKKVNELIRKVGKLEDREVEQALRILEATRKEVAAAVASTEWDLYYLPRMKEAVERAVEGFRLRYQAETKADLDNMWKAGIDMVDSPLQYVGVPIMAPELGMTVLDILQGYSADLIKGLTADAIKKINSEIAMGLMGGKPMQEVMKAVGRNLDDKSVFSTIAGRAEAITRTEMAHVQSAAREARMEQITTDKAGLSVPPIKWKKKWISSGKAKPRPHHAALNGTVVDFDENFPGGIPYPHAPGLPASEVVNCG
jgi:hypothetical protein